MPAFRAGRLFPAGWMLLGLLPAPAPAAEPTAPAEFFEKQVRPLLVARCISCHGEKKPKGGLRLTSRAAILEGGDSGPGALPGKPEQSRLIRAIRHTDTRKMPREKLPAKEIAVLTRWVRLGLPWPKGASTLKSGKAFRITADQRRFWSFQPVTARAVPAVKDTAWPLNPVDRFILARLEARGLRPAPPADRLTLLRRLTFDLTGLPPTPGELEDFLADRSPQAYARAVDRLLASPAYGEHWGRHWLDVAHYADTAGETADFPVPDAYRYRNYVLNAFNTDKAYDRFLREQVAGDILAGRGPPARFAEGVVATGFLAGARRFGYDPQNYHHLTIEDTLDTLGKAVLGLTLSCARCHDHKFDPISQKDYYALYGILASTRYPFPGSEENKRPRDLVPLLPLAQVNALRAPFDARTAALTATLRQREADRARAETELKRQPKTPADAKKWTELRTRLQSATTARDQARKALNSHLARPPAIPHTYAVAEGRARNARVHKRGDPRTPGDEIPRRFLEILGGQTLPKDATGSGRLQLAGWLTDPKNPLTARVLVNRVWGWHFGEGLVRTPSDFGKRGRRPTHPELLDYLAGSFVRAGWSVKALHRLIVLSRTYQMSSAENARDRAADPNNELLWHFERRRLSAEGIRDALLEVSGALDRSPGGPHPFPPERTWGFTQHNPFVAVYHTPRRSVYLMTQRTRRHPFLALFDGADPNSSTARRSTTTVPTQALFFLNNPFVHAQSDHLARRLLHSAGSERQRIDLAHRLAFGRPAGPAEVRAAGVYLRACQEILAESGVPIARREVAAWASYARTLFASNEFVYLD
jgi:hypothetical protein